MAEGDRAGQPGSSSLAESLVQRLAGWESDELGSQTGFLRHTGKLHRALKACINRALKATVVCNLVGRIERIWQRKQM